MGCDYPAMPCYRPAAPPEQAEALAPLSQLIFSEARFTLDFCR